MWYSISSNVLFSRNLDVCIWTCSTHWVCNIDVSSTCFAFCYSLLGLKMMICLSLFSDGVFQPFFSDEIRGTFTVSLHTANPDQTKQMVVVDDP